MSTAGPYKCRKGSEYDDGSTASWSNPGNITSDDESYAACKLQLTKTTSRILKAQDFGFSLPSAAVVTNVSFSYQRKASSKNYIREKNISMLDANGAAGTNKADTSTLWGTSDETITKSGDGSYWGIALSPALVNDIDFGLQIKVSGENSGAYVDYVSCTVTYNTRGCIRSTCRGIGVGSFRGMM